MTFDPFGDFAERGYLRNHEAIHDIDAVKAIEHTAFVAYVSEALTYLAQPAALTYGDILETHRILFDSVYPWAGEDRLKHAPGKRIGRGGMDDLFADPLSIRRAADWALEKGQEPSFIARKPGEVMAYLAHAHPFLDGNGRMMLAVHAELCRRAAMSIDWEAINAGDYLRALTVELQSPDQGHLDRCLAPFVRGSIGREQQALALIEITKPQR